MKNRILALFLVLCMAFSMLPVSAMAEDQIIEEELENDNANLTQVTFVCTPLEAKASVKSDTLNILPQKDGSFLLPIGEYTYTVTAEGYQPLSDQALSISADTESKLELKPVLVQIQEVKNEDNLDDDVLDNNANDDPVTDDDNPVVGTDNDGDDNSDGGENIEQNNSIELQTITVSVPSSTVEIPVVTSQNTEPTPVQVSFACTPGNTVIQVFQDGVEKYAQEDGSFLLLPGEYTYTATADGYEPSANINFIVSPENTDPYTVNLTPITQSIVIDSHLQNNDTNTVTVTSVSTVEATNDQKTETWTDEVILSEVATTYALRTGMTRESAIQWILDQEGTSRYYYSSSIDYGLQCSDLAAWYYDYLGYSLSGMGVAANMTWKDSAVKDGWRRFGNDVTPQGGDIVVFDLGAYGKSRQTGHVGLIYAVDSEKYYYLDYNGDNHHAAGTRRSEPLHNFSAIIRPFEDAVPQNNRPDGYVDSCVGGKGTISIRGWAKDSDTPDLPLTIHVYVGGNAGEGGHCYTRASDETLLIANQYRSDGGIGNHGFDFTIKVEEQGENIPVYVWALDGQGENNNKCINGRGDDEGRVLAVNVQGSSLLHRHSIGFRETTGGSFYCEVNGVQTNEVNAGDKVKIIATPDTGKEIESVTIRRTSDLSELSYSTDLQFDMPSSDVDILVTFCDIGIPIDEEHFPDPVFRQYVLDNIDTFNGGNGYLNNAEIQAITTIGGDLYGLKSLDGMHLFPNLTRLSVHQTDLETLDLSKYPGLIEVHGSHNPKLTTVTLGSSTVLALLHFPQSPIISLDLRNCPNLLDAFQNGEKQDGSFDSHEFVAYKTSDSSLMVMSSTEIITDSNPEPSGPANLPLAKYVNENEMEIAASQTLQLNDRGCIDISEPDDSGWYNKLIAPEISGYTIQSITIVSEEEELRPTGYQIITETTSKETESKIMFLRWDSDSASWDLRIQCYDYISQTDEVIDVASPFSKSRPILTYTYISNSIEIPEGIAIDETNFPDPIFRQYVADNFDTDETKGYLSAEEIAAVKKINCSNLGISSLKGIEHFTSLMDLFCLNNNLTAIDVSANTNLVSLSCDGNNLTALDVSANTNLLYLKCSRNQLTEIDVSNNSRLAILNIDANQLTVLDISKNPDLINDIQGLERTEDENSYYYDALFSYDKNVTLITGESTDQSPTFPDYTLVANPASLICPVGEPIAMTVQTKGTGLTYRWQCQVSQTTQILDFTTNILTLTAETSMDGYRYYCVIKDPYGVQIDTRPLEITVVYKHIVQSGETLSSICTSYGLDYDSCKDAIDTLNGESFDANNLSIGQEILLPISNASAARIAEPSAADGIAIDETNFPDPIFRQYVADRFDIDSVKGYLSKAEIAAITYIETYGSDDKKIVSVKGIELFPELRTLMLDGNAIASIDLTHNLKLEHLNIGHNQLTSIDLSRNSELVWLGCENNFLTTLDLSYSPSLAHLFAFYNNIPEIDITNNPTMVKIVTAGEPTVWGNNGDILQYDPYMGEQSRIRIDKGTKFVYGAENPDGIAINEANFPDPIFRAYVADNIDTDEPKGYLSDTERNSVTTINCNCATGATPIATLQGIAFFPNLKTLLCSENSLTALDLSGNPALETLNCGWNNLTSLILPDDSKLTSINCGSNKLSSIDLSGCTELIELKCWVNQLQELNLNNTTNMKSLYCYGNQLASLDIRNNPSLIALVTDNERQLVGENNSVAGYYGDNSALEADAATTIITGEIPSSDGIAINETNFPDPIFRQYVSDNFDTDETKGYLSAAEIKAVTDIACMNMGISSLKGIEFFTELSSLSCTANPLGSIDVSKNTKLFVFICRACQLTELDVSQNTALTALSCQENSLTSLDVSKLTGLHHLDCSFNNLTSLDISKIPVLVNSYTNGTQYDKGSYVIYSETDDGLIVNNLTVDKNVKIITASLVNITISTPAGINVEIIPKSFLNGKELSEDDAAHTTWPKVDFITPDGILTRTCPPGMLDGKLQALETYSYASGTGGDYPIGMDVWLLEKDEDTGNYNAVRADFLDNLLIYSGTSIRIKGNQGIAVHTTLNTAVWNQLVSGGYHGYQVEEAGLLVSVLTNGGVSDPVLGDPGVIKGVSYERTGTMKSINPNGDTSYYMNTIVFGTDLSKTKWDLACRPYIRLTSADGEEVILYGGTLVRSVRSVAKQIESIYKNDATISKFIQTILDY